MTREIKFRGKSTDTEKWVYGFLSFFYTAGRDENGLIFTDKARIYSPEDGCCYDVWAETVGQFTGLRDKNGKEIYEGDIVKTKEYGIEIPNGKVSFNSVGYDNFIINYIDGGFCLSNNHRCFLLCRGNHLEVNGNIYDSPDLI